MRTHTHSQPVPIENLCEEMIKYGPRESSIVHGYKLALALERMPHGKQEKNVRRSETKQQNRVEAAI